jgi:hypothetical protein
MLIEKQQIKMTSGRGLQKIHDYLKNHKDVSKQNYPSKVDGSI